MSRQAVYAALTTYLRGQLGSELALAFPTLESILGRPLPDAAWTAEGWWMAAGEQASHRAAWRRAGWEVAHVNLAAKVVTFQRLDARLIDQHQSGRDSR
ncbi:MAG: hypothetical protein AB7R89_19770 [Dehalococcoidia bacterium]